MGRTETMPGSGSNSSGFGNVIVHRPGLGVDIEMTVKTENAAEQLGAESAHHRHGDDKGRHAQRDPEQREDRDHRDEAFLAACAQIAERDHPLDLAEDHGRRASISSAASGVVSARSAVLRFFTSTRLAATLRGPITN